MGDWTPVTSGESGAQMFRGTGRHAKRVPAEQRDVLTWG